MVRLNDLLKMWHHRRDLRQSLRTQLSLLEGNGMFDALGGLTDEELNGLISWLPDKGVLVEFGTLFGLTAKAVAQKKPNLQVVAVDNFSWNPFGLPSAIHEAFTRRILSGELASGRVKIYNGTSACFRESCTKAPDAVFFDAQHQYELVRDEIAWAKRMQIGVITGHDYGNPSPVFGVTRAVDEAFPMGIDRAGMCWRGMARRGNREMILPCRGEKCGKKRA